MSTYLAESLSHVHIPAETFRHVYIPAESLSHVCILAESFSHVHILAESFSHVHILAKSYSHVHILAESLSHVHILAESFNHVHIPAESCQVSPGPCAVLAILCHVSPGLLQSRWSFLPAVILTEIRQFSFYVMSASACCKVVGHIIYVYFHVCVLHMYICMPPFKI